MSLTWTDCTLPNSEKWLFTIVKYLQGNSSNPNWFDDSTTATNLPLSKLGNPIRVWIGSISKQAYHFIRNAASYRQGFLTPARQLQNSTPFVSGSAFPSMDYSIARKHSSRSSNYPTRQHINYRRGGLVTLWRQTREWTGESAREGEGSNHVGRW